MEFLESYEEYANEITDAPIEFSRYIAIATAGSLIGRTRWFDFGERKIYPNFYLAVLAPSALYRKSTCISISQNLMRHVDNSKIYPVNFSEEKITQLIKDQPMGIFYFYEFKSLLDLMTKGYASGLKTLLTELYDCPEFYKIARIDNEKTIVLEDPCINIITATTVEWFKTSIEDIEGGFLSRFIYIHSNKKTRNDHIPPKISETKRNFIYNLAEKIIPIEPKSMSLSPEADEAYKLWYDSYCDHYNTINPLYRNLLNRLTIYALKIAMVIQTCTNHSVIITEESIIKAVKLINHIKEETITMCEENMNFSKDDENEKKILKYFKNGEIKSWSEILKYSHMDAWHFKNTIETLIQKNILEIINQKNKLNQTIKLIKKANLN